MLIAKKKSLADPHRYRNLPSCPDKLAWFTRSLRTTCLLVDWVVSSRPQRQTYVWKIWIVFSKRFLNDRARSIQPKFRPVRPRKEDHLKRWTCFFETFPVGPNRSIEFWTEISGNFGWMDRAHKLFRSIISFKHKILSFVVSEVLMLF